MIRRAVMVLALPALIVAQEKPFVGQFTADMIQIVKGKPDSQKISVNKDRMRVEKKNKKGATTVIIMRFDKGVTWTLMEKNQYMEMAGVSAKDVPTIKEKSEDVAEIKKLGEETVNGYPCEKTLCVFKDKSLGEVTQWISKKLMFAVKSETRRGGKVESSSELKNIKEGAPADSVFEIPPGYTKFEMPAGIGDMMKGIVPAAK